MPRPYNRAKGANCLIYDIARTTPYIGNERGVPCHHSVSEICVIATFTYLITIYWHDAKITFDRSIDYGFACNGL